MDRSAPQSIYKTLLRSSKDLDAFLMADMFNLEFYLVHVDLALKKT